MEELMEELLENFKNTILEAKEIKKINDEIDIEINKQRNIKEANDNNIMEKLEKCSKELNIENITGINNSLNTALLNTIQNCINTKTGRIFIKINDNSSNLILTNNHFQVSYNVRATCNTPGIFNKMTTDKKDYLYYSRYDNEPPYKIPLIEFTKHSFFDKEHFNKFLEFLNRKPPLILKINDYNQYKFTCDSFEYVWNRTRIYFSDGKLLTDEDLIKFTDHIRNTIEETEKSVELLKEIENFNIPKNLMRQIKSND